MSKNDYQKLGNLHMAASQDYYGCTGLVRDDHNAAMGVHFVQSLAPSTTI